ncbi:MAG: helix-turn-helix domain-containing protein [Clostridia bacterium]|nr:helix-turn-helix domain-containing protein [Clostridia bacterium]
MFHERLKELRKKAGLTQSEFAAKTGAHYQTVSKWERGISIPDLSMLDIFAKTLHVSIEALLGVEGSDSILGNRFDCKKMGETITNLRKRKGISQAELGEKMKVTSGTVSKWERGVICPDMEKLIALATYFEASPSRIYYGILAETGTKIAFAPQRKRIIWKYVTLSVIYLGLIGMATLAIWKFSTENNPSSSPLGSEMSSLESTNNSESDSDSTDMNTPETSTETLPYSFVLPVKDGELLTKYGFGANATLGQMIMHDGIDLSANQGEEVLACIDGVITIADGELLEGVDIIITSGNGIKVIYRYADPIEELKTGDTVKQGDVIGYIAEARGTEYKSGPHLHIEVYKDDEITDPTEYFGIESE